MNGADNLNGKMMMGCADFLVPLDEPQKQLPVPLEHQLPLLCGRRDSEVYKLDGWSGVTPRPQQQDALPQLRQSYSNIKVGNVQAVPSDIVAYSSNAPRQRRSVCLCVGVVLIIVCWNRHGSHVDSSATYPARKHAELYNRHRRPHPDLRHQPLRTDLGATGMMQEGMDARKTQTISWHQKQASTHTEAATKHRHQPSRAHSRCTSHTISQPVS